MHRRAIAMLVLAGCGRWGFASDDGGEVGDDGGGDGAGGTARVTIDITGDGAVQIAGQWCTTTCTLDLPIGTVIDPIKVPYDGSVVVSDTLACQNPQCELVADLSFSIGFAIAPITANRVFVTSTALAPPFGGLAGADAFCMQRATAASLSGTFVALLSTTATGARARLTGSRGWVRMDGVAVFDQPTDLYTGQRNPISIDETGTFRSSAVANVASGTSDAGIALASRTCADWTSTSGTLEVRSPQYSGGVYNTSSGAGCAASQSLFCAETGKQVAVTPTPWPYGRYVFLATGEFISGSGLATADAMCASEASAAGLPGTYKALVATDGASAAARFSSTAGPWRLPNGPRVRRDDLSEPGPLEAPINLDATGTPVTNRERAWTGAPDMVTAGTAASTCSNWTTGSTGTVEMTRTFDAYRWFSIGPFSCTLRGIGVYCAQD